MTVSATLLGTLLHGVAASRPAANAVAGGTIYSATDTGAITQSDGSSWSTFATISSGLADPMTTRGDIIVRNASNVTARLGIGSSGKVLSSDGTDISWQTPSGGSAVSVDAVPASPDAADDEFTTVSGWTTLGSLTINAVEIASFIHLENTATGTFQVHGLYKTPPSMPFTVTAHIDYKFNANFQSAGIGLLEASPGKLLMFGPTFEVAIDHLSYSIWTSRTARSSFTDAAGSQFYFLRIVVASSTDVTMQVSHDGILYHTVWANINPGFTIGKVGLLLSGQDNSTDTSIVVDWIRFT